MSNTRKATAPDPLAIIKAAKLPEKTVPLCLRGDLVAEMEDLERQVNELADPTGDKRLVGNPQARKLAERITGLSELMHGSTVVFRFRAMRRLDYEALRTDHAPRADDKADRSFGFNRETFFEALTRACLIEPVLDDDHWNTLIDALTEKQWDQLADAAFTLNMGPVDVPFSAAALLFRQSSGEKPRRQPAGASRSSGSTAGNRRKSPSTNTTTKAASSDR